MKPGPFAVLMIALHERVLPIRKNPLRLIILIRRVRIIRHLPRLEVHPANFSPVDTRKPKTSIPSHPRPKILALQCALKRQRRAVQRQLLIGQMRLTILILHIRRPNLRRPLASFSGY